VVVAAEQPGDQDTQALVGEAGCGEQRLAQGAVRAMTRGSPNRRAGVLPLAVSTVGCAIRSKAGLARTQPAENYGLSTIAADVATIITKLGPPVQLVGVSYGGLIALRVAADHPSTISELVLLASAHQFSEEGLQRMRRQVNSRSAVTSPRSVPTSSPCSVARG
jgi:pimeloyl-ACP methyl ester carboxylesterase